MAIVNQVEAFNPVGVSREMREREYTLFGCKPHRTGQPPRQFAPVLSRMANLLRTVLAVAVFIWAVGLLSNMHALAVPAPWQAGVPSTDEEEAWEFVSECVDLPPPDSFEPVPLSPIDRRLELPKLNLHPEAADLPGVGSYSLRPSADDTKSWDIVYLPGTTALASGPVSIAKLWAKTDKLLFQWSESEADDSVRQQVRNILLEVKSGDTAQFIQLRKSIAVPPVVVDFDNSDFGSTFVLLAPPKVSSLHLEITGLPPATVVNKEVLPFRKEGIISFTSLAGAQLLTRLQNKGGDDSFLLKVTPELVEGSRLEFELTRDNLKKMQKRWVQMRAKAQSAIRESQEAISSLNAQIDALSTISGNLAVVQERDRRITSLQGRLKFAVERLPPHRKRLAEAEQRLKAIPTVEKFLTAHDGTTIHFRVFAQTGPRRLMLAESK